MRPVAYHGGVADPSELAPTVDDDPSRLAAHASPTRRAAFVGLGVVSLALGVAGVFLPLLPTVPFLVLSVWCFARSSPRLERWVLDHPRLGPPVHRWREHGVVSLRAKVLASVWLAASTGIAWHMGGPRLGAIAGGACALVLLFLLTRPSRPPG